MFWKSNLIKLQNERIAWLQEEILELNHTLDEVIFERDRLKNTLQKNEEIFDAILDLLPDRLEDENPS